MTQAHHFLGRVRHHAVAACAIRSSPLPRSAMLRSGLAVGSVFVLLILAGRAEAAIIGAFFTNFLCLADRADHLVTRVAVQIAGALLFTLLAAVGLLVAGNPALILIVVFAIALIAGFVHGSTPGAEALPRFGLCCLIVAAYLPLNKSESLLGIGLGTTIAVLVVVADHRIRNGRRGAYNRYVLSGLSYPGPRFSFAYGCAAACGLAIGVAWGEMRPYWVTLTTLLVMQPDRRANTVRVMQRFFGTLAGVVIAFAAVHAIPDGLRTQGFMVLVLGLPFLWPLGFDRNYGIGTAILSSWVLILIDFALPSADLVTPLFLARLSDTAIGCAVALAGSFIVFEAQEKA